MAPVVAMSAFLNNTPVVAMFMPAVIDWARQNRLPVSEAAHPAQLRGHPGRHLTIIGTSTNLVVSGLMAAHPSLPSVGMFDITWVGLPSAVVGMAYLVLVRPLASAGPQAGDERPGRRSSSTPSR